MLTAFAKRLGQELAVLSAEREPVKKAIIGVVSLCLAGCVQDGVPQTAMAPEVAEKPNIIWIMAEDMGPDVGAYGEPEALTPNIDSLARRGMTFDAAFTSAPICSISRSALYTGMYSTSIGAHQHRTPDARKKPLPENVELLTDRFRSAGYYTALLHEVEKPGGPDDWFKGKEKTDWNFKYEGKPYDGNDMALLSTNQPFFAHVQFPETHRGKDWDEAASRIDHPADPAKVDLPPYYPDHPIAREDWANYLNAVMAFDRKVGVVLRRLKEEGLDKNTIVILVADHGRAMVRGKQWLYDSGLHVPLIVYIPEGMTMPTEYTAGRRSSELISGIDLPATSLWFAGINPAGLMQGRSIFDPNQEPRQFVYAARDRADETTDHMRSVRNADFLYIKNYRPDLPYTQTNMYKETQYPVLRLMFRMHKAGTLGPVPSLFMADTKPAEELYDVRSDPHNIVNLASDPKHSATLAAMRARLTTWEEETGDQGRIPEPPEVAAQIAKKAKRRIDPKVADIVKKEGPWRD